MTYEIKKLKKEKDEVKKLKHSNNAKQEEVNRQVEKIQLLKFNAIKELEAWKDKKLAGVKNKGKSRLLKDSSKFSEVSA